MLLLTRVPRRRLAGRAGYWLWLLVVLVVVGGAQRRLAPSSSASTSTTDRALPSSAVQARCWNRPTTTTRLPFDSDSATCPAWSRHTMTVKNDASCSRRPRDRHPEHGPGDPCLGVPQLGVVGQVAGEAHACLGHGASLLNAWPAVCPALGTGGRWTPRHAQGHQGQAAEPTKSAIDQVAERARSGAGLVGGACGWGSGMPAPSGQIPPPWAWWENEAPAARAACSSFQAYDLMHD
jgi:hypothetical protein